MSEGGPTNVERPPRRRGDRLVNGLLALGIAALLVSIIMPSCNRRREEKLAWLAQRACPRTIGRIGMMALMYQNDNGGALPPDLDALQRYAQTGFGGSSTWELFTCPYAHARGVPPKQPGAVCMSSYVYVVPPGVTH